MKHKFAINIALVFLLFLASVIIRLDNLKTPMGRHHEWLTGHVLCTVKIFEDEGAASHYFAPVLTFKSEADQYLVSLKAFKDKNNYSYYTSYPPFCFILPHVVFTITNATTSVPGIRILGLANHFLCALLILMIFNRLFKRSIREHVFIPSIIAYSIYLFPAGNLWFHGHVWFADTLVHLFILGAIYIFISILEDPQEKKGRKLLLLFVATFLGIYTEWLAVFVAFYMFLFLLFRVFRNRAYFSYLTILATATVFSIGLTVFQYSSICGFDLLKNQAVGKYKERSGYDQKASEAGSTVHTNESWKKIAKNYRANYSLFSYFAPLCAFAVAVIILINLFRKRIKIISIQAIIFSLLLLSIFTHHAAFFNFTAIHDFSTLKASMFLSLFIPFSITLVANYFNTLHKCIVALGSLSTIVCVHYSITEYYGINNHEYTFLFQKVIGEAVAKHAKSDEIVYSDANTDSHVISWYAKRNVVRATSVMDAIDHLRQVNYRKGLFVKLYDINEKYFVNVMRINTDGKIEPVGQ